MRLNVTKIDGRVADEILGLWKSKGKESVLKTTGLSMVPTIEPDDEIVLRHTELDEIKRGDLVTFKVGPEVVTHRVIKRIEKDGRVSLLQKGDSGPRCFPLPAECVVGKVVEIRLKSGNHVIPMTSLLARSFAHLVALLELWFAGPIRFLSDILRKRSRTDKPGGLVSFCYRNSLRLRSRTIRPLLKAMRLLCRKRLERKR